MKTIAITTGEPAGIGPDLLAMLAYTPLVDISLVVIGNRTLLEKRAQQIAKPIRTYSLENGTRPHCGDGTLVVVDVPLSQPVVAGHTDPRNAPYVIKQLDIAIAGCLKGDYHTVVTAPINKAVICQANFSFRGHTEYFAQACDCDSVMLLETDSVRVALATTHIPLRTVPECISKALLKKTIGILHNDMRTRFRLAQPRIAVCGLNPHAGEQGYLGSEEITVIAPAIAECAAHGINVFGPIAADTAFIPKQLAQYDVVLAMYHDQGLAAIKCIGFGKVVNITLGLPFVRTSVDHGTALDLAGSGRIEVTSLELAVHRAAELSAPISNSAS